MSFTFIHTADLHLDSPFEGLTAVAPDLAQVLKDATFRAFDRVVDLAVQERAAFLLIAGDVYDGADRSLRAQLKFRDGLIRAAAHGVAAYVVHGNHDPLSGWEAGIAMPPEVHRFGAEAVEEVKVKQGGETLARIFGISYPISEVRANLAVRFPKVKPGPFAIGLLHGNVGGNPAYDNYAPCSLADLDTAGLDYWALGHFHTRQILRERAPAVVYPGNPQGLSWREEGARGCYRVRVDDTGGMDLTFAATDLVRWRRQQVDIREFANLDDLFEGLHGVKEEVRREAGGASSLLRVQLTGRGEAHGLLRPLDLSRDLVQPLREGEVERGDFVWLDSLEDATRAVLDLEQRRTFKDFVGDFLAAAENIRRAPGPAASLRQILSEQPGFRTMARELGDLSDDDLLAILGDAETLGLDLLILDGE
jgi:DNA repair exonuclease SbcCD nuclease subunit